MGCTRFLQSTIAVLFGLTLTSASVLAQESDQSNYIDDFFDRYVPKEVQSLYRPTFQNVPGAWNITCKDGAGQVTFMDGSGGGLAQLDGEVNPMALSGNMYKSLTQEKKARKKRKRRLKNVAAKRRECRQTLQCTKEKKIRLRVRMAKLQNASTPYGIAIYDYMYSILTSQPEGTLRNELIEGLLESVAIVDEAICPSVREDSLSESGDTKSNPGTLSDDKVDNETKSNIPLK